MINACFQDHASTRLTQRIEKPLQKQIYNKPTQIETELASPEDERRYMMGLSYENRI